MKVLRRTLLPATSSRRATRFWLAASLAAGLAYAVWGVQPAFKHHYAIQSDARQMVVWLERYIDPELFRNDLIADYYQSVAPIGYLAFYKAFALAGVHPILLSKLLPVGLGVLTSLFCFLAAFKLLRVPLTGFIATVLLNQCLWTDDSLMSSTPRAFLYPLFLAFIYCLVSEYLVRTLVALVLEAFFYPPIFFVSLGVIALQLFRWESRRLRLNRNPKTLVLCAWALATLLFLIPYSSQASRFGPRVSKERALELPASLAGKRLTFLRNENAWDFWFLEGQSGMISRPMLPPPLIFAGLLLPLLFYGRRFFPLTEAVDKNVNLLALIPLVGVALFLTAHALMFSLYLPNRYTIHTFPVVLSLAGAIAITIVLDSVLRWAEGITGRARIWRASAVTSFTVAVLGLLIAFPHLLKEFPYDSWIPSRDAELFEFLSEQPKDSMIATLSGQGANIPAFSLRSVLTGDRFSNPYQEDYYVEVNNRFAEMVSAHYTTDIEELEAFINKYQVNFIVIDNRAFRPRYLRQNRVVRRFKPLAGEIRDRLEAGIEPALKSLAHECAVFEDKHFTVVRTDLIPIARRK
jgi:hypothetical protein